MEYPTGKLARWSLRLQELEFDFMHRPGVKQQSKDAKSRLYTMGADGRYLKDDIPVLSLERIVKQFVLNLRLHADNRTDDAIYLGHLII